MCCVWPCSHFEIKESNKSVEGPGTAPLHVQEATSFYEIRASEHWGEGIKGIDVLCQLCLHNVAVVVDTWAGQV